VTRSHGADEATCANDANMPSTSGRDHQRDREVLLELIEDHPLDWRRFGRQAGHVLRKSRTRAYQDLQKLEALGLIAFPSWLLGATASITGLPGPVWVPAATGAAIGTVFALLNRFAAMRMHVAPREPLCVLLTGSSRGLGKALARELLLGGDRVVVSSRSPEGVAAAVEELRAELGDGCEVHGVACDVSVGSHVERLAGEAARIMGRVDVWINNAGYSGSYQPLMQATPEQVAQVVSTNLLGVALCSRAAARLFTAQPGGGHLFNMDGAGADGLPTPNYAAYGATKAGIRQLSGSLRAELKGTEAKVHLLSPGMILTELLLEGSPREARAIPFNILCEHPETVAGFLVPRLRSVVARGLGGTYVKYLTPASAMWRLLTAPARIGRFFDSAGNRVYLDEAERIHGRGARATQRSVAAARAQNTGLQFAYSLSLALAVAVMVLEANVMA